LAGIGFGTRLISKNTAQNVMGIFGNAAHLVDAAPRDINDVLARGVRGRQECEGRSTGYFLVK
jgi:hypothetical protein